jgi:hypothetical protein
VPGLESVRGKDVSQFAILILKKRDKTVAIRIVFNRLDHRDHVVFVALEVDQAVHALVTAATKTGSRKALVVPTAGFGQRDDQRLGWLAREIGQFREIVHAGPAVGRVSSFYIFLCPWAFLFFLEQVNVEVRLQNRQPPSSSFASHPS